MSGGALLASTVVAVAPAGAAPPPGGAAEPVEQWTVTSPGEELAVTVEQDAEGALRYSVDRGDEEVLARADLGVTLTDADLTTGLELTGREDVVIDETYELLTGKAATSHDHAVETTFTFANADGRELDLVVRAYDDAAAYRYEIDGSGEAELTGESSEFRVPEGATAWVQPWKYNYEEFYDEVAVGDLDAGQQLGFPVLVEQASGSWMLLSEAAVDDTYAVSRVTADGDGGLALTLPEDSVSSALPWRTPWRLAMFGDELGEVVESTRIFDLNPTSRIEDTSWIEPGRVAWSWWSDAGSPRDEARQREFVDFAADQGWEYVLVDEGWSADWVPALADYAAERDVELLLWSHWTGLDTEAEREEKLARWKSWGVAGVKVDFMDADTQERMGFYWDVLEATAEHELLLNYHGSTAQQGWARTWPHLMTMEGVWGAEQYWGSWPASHNVDLVFTRNVTGSMDYTPVVFSTGNRQTTLAHELATGIVFESALQHLADSPESYQEHDAALPLLSALPTTWDETRLLSGRPGEHAALARRSGDTWFLGVISGTDAIRGELALDVLGDGTYVAEVYRDGVDEDGEAAIVTATGLVTADTALPMGLTRNGGLAAVLRPATPEETQELDDLALPPQVTLTAPTDGAVFAGGSPVSLAAEADDVDGQVASVDFLVDGEVVASADTAPYTAEWDSVPVGRHTLRAVATDDEGNTGTSGAASFWVQPSTEDMCLSPAASDDFDGGELDRERWTVVNEVAEDLRQSDGALRIDTRAGDLYAGGAADNIVLQDMPDGAWQATTRITADLDAGYQQAGLVLYEGRGNYIAVNLNARSDSERRFQFIREDDGSPRYTGEDWFTVPADFPDTYEVRLTSDGQTVTAAYSTDGETFTPFGRPADATYLDDPRLGLIAVSGGGGRTTTEAAFERFELAVEDCPDVTPPSVTAELDGDRSGEVYTGPVTVTVEATDEGSGVELVEVALDDGAWTAYQEAVEVTAPGEHTVRFRATDAAGNVSEPGEVSFTIRAPATGPVTKDDCKAGGWRDYTDPSFRNQGQCVASVASGGASGRGGPGR